MAQPRLDSGAAEPPLASNLGLPTWKTAVCVVSAVLLAALFLIAGTWKITDPVGAGARLAQAKVPGPLSIPSAVLLGIAETLAGVLLLVPRFRRWGAWLTGFLLLVFMAYIGFFYNELRGAECSCFPWLKRSVGPGFFIGDGVMLLLALLAGLWARPSFGVRSAAIVLGSVVVFALASFGMNMVRQTGVKAPDTVTVDGKPASLTAGRVFLFFFDPECSHCEDAARRMAKYAWKDTKIVSIPTRVPHFAQDFLNSTGLKAGVSPDLELLKKTFPFGDPPFGVALENGREKAPLPIFDATEPLKTLRELDFVQ